MRVENVYIYSMWQFSEKPHGTECSLDIMENWPTAADLNRAKNV